MLDSRHDPAIMESLAANDVRVEPDEGKLAELLLLVGEELADDPFGGAVKVNKVLFFAEFAHMRLTGRPITGVPYQKLRYGPAPRRLPPVRDRLVDSGSAELVTESVLGRLQHRLVPKRPARRQLFTETELQTVKEAVAFLRGRTGAEASELSHDELGWQLVNERDTIPFVTAYLAPDQARTSPRIQERAAQIAEEYAQRIHPAP
jgi:hypothetical protein